MSANYKLSFNWETLLFLYLKEIVTCQVFGVLCVRFHRQVFKQSLTLIQAICSHLQLLRPCCDRSWATTASCVTVNGFRMRQVLFLQGSFQVALLNSSWALHHSLIPHLHGSFNGYEELKRFAAFSVQEGKSHLALSTMAHRTSSCAPACRATVCGWLTAASLSSCASEVS